MKKTKYPIIFLLTISLVKIEHDLNIDKEEG